MFSEFNNTAFHAMSDPEISSHPPEFQFLRRPSSEFAIDCQFSTSKPPKDGSHGRERSDPEENSHLRSAEGNEIEPQNSAEDAEESVVDGDDDGYQTPTSSKDKIPAPRCCPLAPKKPRSRPLMKRKASSATRSIRVDISAEDIELFFRPIIGCKIKEEERIAGETE